jgi:hypothetical protein
MMMWGCLKMDQTKGPQMDQIKGRVSRPSVRKYKENPTKNMNRVQVAITCFLFLLSAKGSCSGLVNIFLFKGEHFFLFVEMFVVLFCLARSQQQNMTN